MTERSLLLKGNNNDGIKAQIFDPSSNTIFCGNPILLLTLTIHCSKLSPEDIKKLKMAMHSNPASE